MEGQEEVTREDLVDFLGFEGGAMVADSQGLEAEPEAKEPEAPTAEPEAKEPEPEAEEKDSESATTEPDPAIKVMQDKLDAIAEDVTGLKAAPENEPEPELSTREKLGLPDLNSEEYKDHFELYPEQKALMQGQQDAMIKQQETLDKQQGEINQGKAQLQAEQTKQFWSAVEQGHSDFSDYVSIDGELTPKFSEWVKDQPAFLQPAYEEAYKQGSASDVVDLVALIKGPEAQAATVAAIKPDVAAQKQSDLAAKGEEKIKAAEGKEVLPQSLTDVPGQGKVANPLNGLPDSTDIVADLHKAHGGDFNKQQAIVDSMI